MAVNCGTPTPAIILVVHMDPGPIPTLRPSTSPEIRSSAAWLVAMFPTIKSASILSFIFLADLIILGL